MNKLPISLNPFYFIKNKKYALENNLFSNCFYQKQYIRKKIKNTLEHVNLKTVDIYTKVIVLRIKNKKLTKGKSYFTKRFCFMPSQFNTNFELFFNSYKKQCSTAFVLEKLYQKFHDKKVNSFFILNSKKGGYVVYSSGIRGYLPKNQAKHLFFQYKRMANILWKSSQKNNLYSIYDHKQIIHIVKNYFAICLPILKIKISITARKSKKSYITKKKQSLFVLKYTFFTLIKIDNKQKIIGNKKNFRQAIAAKKQQFKSTQNKKTY